MRQRPAVPCRCGSGEYHYALYDGHNIFLCYVCSKCQDAKIRSYRPDIFERYQCNETIEPEDY